MKILGAKYFSKFSPSNRFENSSLGGHNFDNIKDPRLDGSLWLEIFVKMHCERLQYFVLIHA